METKMASSKNASNKTAPKAAKKKVATKKVAMVKGPKTAYQSKGIAGGKGSSFAVAGVTYKGKSYPSLWQVWGKRNQDGCGPTGLNLGSRSQCITFRKALRAARPGQAVTWENPDTGKKHTFKTFLSRDSEVE
jgi:hypothetical protein